MVGGIENNEIEEEIKAKEKVEELPVVVNTR
jgi:hypothetical protein